MLSNIIIITAATLITAPAIANVKFKLKENSNFSIETRSTNHQIFKIDSISKKIYINGIELGLSGNNKISANSVGKIELRDGAVTFKKIAANVVNNNLYNTANEKLATENAVKIYVNRQINNIRLELGLNSNTSTNYGNQELPINNWGLIELQAKCITAYDTSISGEIDNDTDKNCYVDYDGNHNSIVTLPDTGEPGAYFTIYHRATYATLISKQNTSWENNFYADSDNRFIYFLRIDDQWVPQNVEEFATTDNSKNPPQELLNRCLTPSDLTISYYENIPYSVMPDNDTSYKDCYVDSDQYNIRYLILPEQPTKGDIFTFHHYSSKKTTISSYNTTGESVDLIKNGDKVSYQFNGNDWYRKY